VDFTSVREIQKKQKRLGSIAHRTEALAVE
jgi:hypothetical protein